MAGKKISQLSQTSTTDGSYVAVANNGTNYKYNLGNLQEAIDANGEQITANTEDIAKIKEEYQHKLTFSSYSGKPLSDNGTTVKSINCSNGVKIEPFGESLQISADQSVLASVSALTAETQRATSVENGLSQAVSGIGNAMLQKSLNLQDVANQQTALNNLTAVTNAVDGSILMANGGSAIWVNDFGEELFSYGVEWDENVSSPTLTRVGNMALHRTLPIQSEMKAYTLTSDGTATLVDWSNPTLDGSIGNVMTKIPAHWQRAYSFGSKKGVRWSARQLPGYSYIPDLFIGTYQGVIDRTNNKLMSIVNMSEQYRGGDNSSALQAFDGTYRTLLGRPASSFSRTNGRTYARNNGSVNWNLLTNLAWKQMYWAFVIEYATFNSQLAVNSSLTSEGYHQGGLGAGVSEWTQAAWSSFYGGDGGSMRYPFIPCGASDSLGNESGQVIYNVVNGDGTTLYESKVNRYRGIEMPFAHIWQWIDGINIMVNPTSGDNLSHVFTCDSPSVFQDSNYEGYREVGIMCRGNNYGKTMLLGEEADILHKTQQSASTSYLCDYMWNSILSSATLMGLGVGGTANFGAYCGLSATAVDSVPSNVNPRVGSRLCYIP